MNLTELGRQMYERAGLRPDDPPCEGITRVAAELLQDGDFLFVSDRAPIEATIGRYGGRTRIVVARMSPRRRNFAIARMLARIELEQLRAWSERSERLLGGFLVAPEPSVCAVVREFGIDLEVIASTFVVTETCAALRVVEVGAADGIVVTPERVYRPGRLMSWACDEQARAIARARRPRSVRRVPILDEPDRVALYRHAG